MRKIIYIKFFFSIILNRAAYRMIYALSNSGADPNITDENGNTPLHEALIRGFVDIGLDLIQVDISI
jgi:ankyrin repeat protein